MHRILFLVFLVSFFLLSCEDTPNTNIKNSCDGVTCDGWKTCNDGTCELNSGRCDTTNDCSGSLVCDGSHYCSEVQKTCDGITCSGNGDCLISGGSPLCVCYTGYHAENLDCVKDIEKDPCENITCSGKGSCANSGGNAICICDAGYHADGVNCVENLDSCDGITCSGNGDCAVSGNTAICVCNQGYHADGLNCVENIDLCDGITCSNHGSCAVSNNTAICVCNNGFYADGLECLENQDPCDGVTCSNHGTCLLSGNEAVCVCNDGFYSDGLNCELENPCEGVLCDDWQICVEGTCELKSNQCERTSDCINDLICDSNHNCVDPIDPCSGVTCSNNGVCGIVSSNAVCICNDGYIEDGLNCISETNPCDGISCSGSGTCVVSNNSPICICQEGYHQEGLNCVVDVNPCQDITCSGHGVCAVAGSSPICVCDSGYLVDGLTCVETTDPCENINCNNNGTCAVSGDEAICICNTGYHSEGATCVEDIDTCDGVTCSDKGICAVSGGVAICVCDDGYHSEALTCIENLDPCEGVTCSGNGNCLVSGNAPICICDSGYTANDLECVQVITQGELIISEFMANPKSVYDTSGEWIELYNTTSRTLDLSNVTINNGTSFVNLSGAIAPNSYFVVAKSVNSLVPYDLAMSFSSLGNSGGTFSIKNNGVVLHEITYPIALDGKSWQLDVASYSSYSDFSNWCAGASAISVDNADLGSPGEANTTCSVDLCVGVECNNGQCLADDIEYICVCDAGYVGELCDTCQTGYHFDTDGVTCVLNSDPCDTETCNNHGDCLGDSNTGEFICLCDTGYTDINNSDDCDTCDTGYHFDTDGVTCVLDGVQEIQVGDLVITEVMANPDHISDTSGEWIEIYNTTNNNILLENFSILKNTTPYSLLESGKIVPANSYFVIARSATADLPQMDAYISSMSLTNSTGVSVSIKMGDLILDTIASYQYDPGVSWQRDLNGDWCNSVDTISSTNTDLGTPGFENPICGVVDLCTGVTCDGHGICESDATDYLCFCDTGYTAIDNDDDCGACDTGYIRDGNGNCVVDTTDMCTGVTCSGNGECLADVDYYICFCDTGYAGDDCELCATGYIGDGNGNCVVDTTDMCTGVTCSGNGECAADVDYYICFCDAGYAGDDCELCDTGYIGDGNGNCVSESITVTWCNVQYPASITANYGDDPTMVYGQVYIAGVTDTQDTSNPSVISQLGYTYDWFGIDLPIVSGDFEWEPATFNVRSGNNHEYQAGFPTDYDVDSFYYIYRFSVDNGATWKYCDLDGVIVNSVNPGTAVIQ